MEEEVEEKLPEIVEEEIEEELPEIMEEEIEEELPEIVEEEVEEEVPVIMEKEIKEEVPEFKEEELEEEISEIMESAFMEQVPEKINAETAEELSRMMEEFQKLEESLNGDEMDAAAAMFAFEESIMAELDSISGLESYTPEDTKIPENWMEELPKFAEEESEVTDNNEDDDIDLVEIEPIALEEIDLESLESTSDSEVIEETVATEEKSMTIPGTDGEMGIDFDFEKQLVAETKAMLEKVTNPETDKQKEMDLVERLMMEADNEPTAYQPLADETPEDKRRRILQENAPTTLTDEQKALFSYFCKVPGMNEQILNAINGVYRYAYDKTSRRGNIAIMGSHGTGKTRLGEGLVKAICKRFGLEAAKYARIDALELNRKDIAAVVGKMAGGFLMVERAHLLTDATILQLSTAMEFRTDSMVLIIEDEKNEMRELLATYPVFAEKFETVISIPVFTNDELVTFARTYAKENGFKMDEMGVLALYALIGDNQREDEPITIAKVKSMVDTAIRHANNARLGRRISKRHVDEDGRILLYEKDFED